MISRLWNHLEKEKFGPHWIEKAEREVEKLKTWSITKQGIIRAVGVDQGVGWHRQCECIIVFWMGGGKRQGIGVGGIIIFISLFFFYGLQNSFKFHWFWVKPESGMCEVGEIINILSLEKDKGQHVSQGIFWSVWSGGNTPCDDMILHNWQGLDQSLIQGQRKGAKPYKETLCKWVHCMKL